MKLIHTCEGTVRALLALANYPTTRNYDNIIRPIKAEFAAIILALDPDAKSLENDNR